MSGFRLVPFSATQTRTPSNCKKSSLGRPQITISNLLAEALVSEFPVTVFVLRKLGRWTIAAHVFSSACPRRVFLRAHVLGLVARETKRTPIGGSTILRQTQQQKQTTTCNRSTACESLMNLGNDSHCLRQNSHRSNSSKS